MSDIFRLKPAENAIWLVGEPGRASDMAGFRGTALAGTWQPPPADFATAPGLPGVASDIPWVSESTIALPSTGSPLAEALAPHGEFLPVDGPSRYWLFNGTVVLDGAILPGTDGEWLDEFRMFDLRNPVFDPKVIRGHPVFRVPEIPVILFVDETIVAATTKSELTGLEFVATWSG